MKPSMAYRNAATGKFLGSVKTLKCGYTNAHVKSKPSGKTPAKCSKRKGHPGIHFMRKDMGA